MIRQTTQKKKMFQLSEIIQLRRIVGFLGEKEQFGWWQSSFYSPVSTAFLYPIFTRTQSLAQLNGVARAAALVHDEFIGVGAVYHLFRLPEGMEQRIVREMQTRHAPEAPLAQAEALAWLREQAGETPVATIGPVRIGRIADLRDPASWAKVAALYLYVFESGERIYPYFQDSAE